MKTTHLFGDVQLVGEDGDLLGEPLLVDANSVGEFFDCCSKPIALLDEPRRRSARDPMHSLLDVR